MTDETKKLFDAPWLSEEYEHGHGAWVVRRSKGYLIAENLSGQDANRLARLPELYDALQEAIFEINRLIDAWEDGMDFGDFCDEYLKEYGNVPSGFTCEWAQLLTKVSKGE